MINRQGQREAEESECRGVPEKLVPYSKEFQVEQRNLIRLLKESPDDPHNEENT